DLPINQVHARDTKRETSGLTVQSSPMFGDVVIEFKLDLLSPNLVLDTPPKTQCSEYNKF
ncbi:MAG: hypothetical protein Q8834_02630, partial [Candidatus Phytoplasma australasiaticum]|nr:hypothetical protein [Candidatus Phytoplasma australasiaticum]